MYIWQRKDWPNFHWDERRLIAPLADARLKQGRMLGAMTWLGFDLKRDAQLAAATEDAIKTSEIEGDLLDRASVRSSVARHLGIEDAAVIQMDRRIEGVVAMTLDATENHLIPLTEQRLFGWQAALFPRGMSDSARIRTGAWRDDARGPMQVVSGPIGRQRVHFEAPPAAQVETEMARFLAWFNRPDAAEGLLRAGIAHFWFVTIHPFEDGNGRLARAVADQALAQSEGINQRFYSLSGQIRRERSVYYSLLERGQRGTLDITEWLLWFLACFGRAIDGADATSSQVLSKAAFWQAHAQGIFSARQKQVLNRVLDGVDRNLTAKKWAAIGKCSVPTAQRDINELIETGALQRNPGGSKNTSYDIVSSPNPA